MAKQADAIASLHLKLGIGKRKPRQSPSLRRREIASAQVEALERVLADIRQKARVTPAWANAYFSAATAVEIEIASIKKDNP